MVTKHNRKAGPLSRIWGRVNEPWRWTLLAAIPGTAIASVYAIAAYFVCDAGAKGPAFAYAVTAAIIFLGTPGATLLMEKISR